MSLEAKLTEKNIKALTDGGSLDRDFGLCTPGSVAIVGTDVKAEFPSLEPLKELVKLSKTTQLM